MFVDAILNRNTAALTQGLEAPTLYMVKNSCITLQLALWVLLPPLWIQVPVDHVVLWYVCRKKCTLKWISTVHTCAARLQSFTLPHTVFWMINLSSEGGAVIIIGESVVIQCCLRRFKISIRVLSLC